MNDKETMAKAEQYFDAEADNMFYNEWQQEFFKLTDYPEIFEKAKQAYLSAVQAKLAQGQDIDDSTDFFAVDAVMDKDQIFDVIQELAMETPDDAVTADFKRIASIASARLGKKITGEQVRHCKPVWEKYVAEACGDEAVLTECAELFEIQND